MRTRKINVIFNEWEKNCNFPKEKINEIYCTLSKQGKIRKRKMCTQPCTYISSKQNE